MDLKAATEDEIYAEINRRKMVARDASIKKFVEEINRAYNSGNIETIKISTQFRGSSAEQKSYHVHMK
jgi:hypothetical protein